MMRVEGRWREVGWEAALAAAAALLRDGVKQAGAGRIGFLGSPASTTEEAYLLGRIARGLGSRNVDTRLRQADFSDQHLDPPYPGLGIALNEIDSIAGLLLVGCQLREEAPVFAHRVRKAALAGGKVSLLSTRGQICYFPLQRQLVTDAGNLVAELAAMAAGGALSPEDRAIVESLSGGRSAIVLGGEAMRHTRYADLRAAAAALAGTTGATLGYLPDGGNAVGCALAGALPHRLPGAQPDRQAGLDAASMFNTPLAACVLFGGIEAAMDIGHAGSNERLAACPRVIAITPYADPETMDVAQVMLPIGTFAETSGTYVNVEGRWQEFRGCAQPVGESRPGWKVLRVLGNQLGLEGFGYETSADVLAELRTHADDVRYDGRHPARSNVNAEQGGTTTLVPIYQVDATVRRAPALQATRAAQSAAAAG
jgi:NADH-quinone oxidoreductase subunit G